MLMKDCYLVSILSEMSVNTAMDIYRAHSLAILVSTFHHGKQPSAIDQISAGAEILSAKSRVQWGVDVLT
ncbi:hypothetical protein C5167_037210 [Papaver somniferum]|uniref:Uncharacterized protein n=1 Tax=Papaver somniferum TaxID=3469 RepID=A0A4Y7I9F2_PAPSO|nr:hypothetical protein C5167_037210 [Papaver somniferum]